MNVPVMVLCSTPQNFQKQIFHFTDTLKGQFIYTVKFILKILLTLVYSQSFGVPINLVKKICLVCKISTPYLFPNTKRFKLKSVRSFI